MEEDHTLSTTTSLCPTCLDRVPGRYEARDGAVHLTRTCPEHGTVSPKVWDSLDHWRWARDVVPDPGTDAGSGSGVDDDTDPGIDAVDGLGAGCGCEGACGPADEAGNGADTVGNGGADATDLVVDNDHACLAVVEVTGDCNLSCSYCFASSGPGGDHRPFEEVVDLLDVVRDGGGPRPIQFSGGEPTVRDDLPALVERAVEMGFEHVQVNTNGLRLAREEGYADRLAEAGVTAVYLQFDGLRPETYEAIREVDIAAEKRAAIEACRAADLPVVLVPTVVPGTNDDEMGDIVRFALANRDVVRSVNFQPVAHFGRYADHHGRFSLDEAARRLADQFDPLDARDLLPIPCCSTYCQTATALLPDGEGGAVPVTRFFGTELLGSFTGMVDEADWLEFLAGTPTGRDRACSAAGCCGMELPGGADDLLGAVLPVSFTGFMDADAADVDRLGNCCISVPTPSGDLVPFCAYNMTTADGRYALRQRHDWGGRPTVDAPLSRSTAESDDD